jgi:hypothetical protein
MNAGKELDQLVSHAVLGHKHTSLILRNYSTSIEDAWEVVSKMGITLIPIEEGSWFAMVGPSGGWKSQADFMLCLQKGEFAKAGAAVSDSAPLSICLAAVNAIGNRSNVETYDN